MAETKNVEGPTHGQDGWTLADYEWSEKYRHGRFVYRRKDQAEPEVVYRPQP